jgi:hypothetical protein
VFRSLAVSRRLVAVSVCTALVLLSLDAAVWPGAARATPASISSAKAIPWGGRHMPATSAQPGTTGTGSHLMAAGDAAGIQWSTDGGLTWHPQNDGLANGQTPVMTIAWQPGSSPARAWIAYGKAELVGGVITSVLGGIATTTVLPNGDLSQWTTLGKEGNPGTQCGAVDNNLVDASALIFQGTKGGGDQTSPCSSRPASQTGRHLSTQRGRRASR